MTCRSDDSGRRRGLGCAEADPRSFIAARAGQGSAGNLPTGIASVFSSRVLYKRLLGVAAVIAVVLVTGFGMWFGRPGSTVVLSSDTLAETNAVQWATHQIGSTQWDGLCLSFAFDAYLDGSQMNLEGDVRNVAFSSETDPEDVWGNGGSNFTAGTWEATSDTTSIPYGALVFFDAKPGYSSEDYSHVTIMGSGGVMISTPDVAGSAVHTETFAQVAGAWNTLVGWWLPAGASSTPQPPIPPSVPPSPSPTPPPTSTHVETTGGLTHTWTDYETAGGTAGATIPGGESVEVACKVQGFRVADGNTWWYMIATSPWDDEFYASADAFYNDRRTTGSLHGTPFVDEAVTHMHPGRGSDPAPQSPAVSSAFDGTVTNCARVSA